MRTKNSVRNIISNLLGQFLVIGLNFSTRSIFIKELGAEYLGVNGLFTNIISILSLAEMGVGTAIIYSLYEPIAKNKEFKIKALMNFYNRAYKVISIIILVIGIIIIPFIPSLGTYNLGNNKILLIYILFLINTIASYLYAYKRSIVIASQKEYILNIYKYLFKISLNLTQIVILIYTKNYVLFLVIQIIMTLVENITVSLKINKEYPIIKDTKSYKLSKDEQKQIIKNVKGLLFHKIGATLVNSTDNILISKFVGIYWVGLYSNYALIIGALNLVIAPIFSALTASIGNLIVTEDGEKTYDTYKVLLFINFWIAGFSSICLINLFTPFITLWIGREYLFNNYIMIIIVMNFYLLTIRRSTLVYKDSFGLFYEDRYKSIIEGLINIVVSILLVKSIGLIGIFLGTFISTLSTVFWIEPYVLYKYGFDKSFVYYIKLFFRYLFITLISLILTTWICSYVDGQGILEIVQKIIVCAILPNVIFGILLYKTNEFKRIKGVIKNNIICIE